MNTQVTLTIPSDIYIQAERLANSANRDVAEVLAETIVWEWPIIELNAEQKAMEEEERAFQDKHSKLLLQHAGEYVAIYQGEMVDSDSDQLALVQRVDEKYDGQVVLIAQVLPEPDEVYTFRSPRLGGAF